MSAIHIAIALTPV